jgi:RNA-binding protein YlmH
MKEEQSKEVFAARIEDMCRLAGKRHSPVYSPFLNEAEQYDAERILSGRRDVSFAFNGGSGCCVRKILRVSEGDEAYSGETDDDFPICTLTLTFRKADKPAHRDFLGAFMALGIKRETVGDIFIGEGAAVVFCTKTARDMIADCVTTVGRVGVSVIDGETPKSRAAIQSPRFEEISLNIASERADCIVSGITGLSREKAASFIRSGGFMLNYSECDNISKGVSEGDVLTLRGYGKFVVLRDTETTKKGRLKIILKKYI